MLLSVFGYGRAGKKWTKKSNAKIWENCSKLLIMVYMMNHFMDRREYLHDSSLQNRRYFFAAFLKQATASPRQARKIEKANDACSAA